MKRLTVASAVVILAFSTFFWGQSSTSSLRGIVSDPQGAVVRIIKDNQHGPVVYAGQN